MNTFVPGTDKGRSAVEKNKCDYAFTLLMTWMMMA